MTPPSPLTLVRTVFRDTDAEKGTIRVPVRHSEPDGPSLELRFVRLWSGNDAPGPPVMFLSGGPGLSGIRAGEGRLFPLFNALRQHSDVILLDQRPCVADEWVPRAPLPRAGTEHAFMREDHLRAICEQVLRDAETLAMRGIPVAALNTAESADDVVMLLRALYGDSVRTALLGWSYGSHLAMAVMKRHESLVVRAVLAAPEGPDHTLKRPLRIQEHLERLGQRASFDVTGALDVVLQRLEQDPARVLVRWENAAETETTFMGRFDLEWIVSEGAADPRVLGKLPAWLARMERGDFAVIGEERLLRGAWQTLREELPFGIARYAMDCASGATAARRRLIEAEVRATLLGATIDFPLPDVCDTLGCPDLGDSFRAPLRSDASVLFITGTLDCRTPAENVAELAPGLPNHQHLVVEDAGHSDLLLASAAQAAIVRFVAGESVSGRVAADTKLQFDKP